MAGSLLFVTSRHWCGGLDREQTREKEDDKDRPHLCASSQTAVTGFVVCVCVFVCVCVCVCVFVCVCVCVCVCVIFCIIVLLLYAAGRN